MGCVSVVLADAACFIGFPVADAFRGVVLKEAQWIFFITHSARGSSSGRTYLGLLVCFDCKTAFMMVKSRLSVWTESLGENLGRARTEENGDEEMRVTAGQLTSSFQTLQLCFLHSCSLCKDGAF